MAVEKVRVTIGDRSFMAKRKAQPKTRQAYRQKMKRVEAKMKKNDMPPGMIRAALNKMEMKLDSYRR